jgi:hypothetical protein
MVAIHPHTRAHRPRTPPCFFASFRVRVDYTAYDRDQLDGFGLGKYADTLLASQSKSWNELNEDEREAASRFCFFEEAWDRDPLGTW